jgi:hypothetical protein
MARAYAVDDFDAIRARLAELRRERATAEVETMEDAAEQRLKISLTPGRRLAKDLMIVRRLRGVGDARIWPPKS